MKANEKENEIETEKSSEKQKSSRVDGRDVLNDGRLREYNILKILKTCRTRNESKKINRKRTKKAKAAASLSAADQRKLQRHTLTHIYSIQIHIFYMYNVQCSYM